MDSMDSISVGDDLSPEELILIESTDDLLVTVVMVTSLYMLFMERV